MKVKEESEKAGLKLNIQKTKIVTSGPRTSWQIDGETLETDRLYFLGLQSDCSHEIKRCLLLGEKSYDQPRQHTKKQRHYFADKSLFSQSCGFPVVMYGCESWTIKKAERQRISGFELWCWRRLLRVPWIARSNQSILKEISPKYWLDPCLGTVSTYSNRRSYASRSFREAHWCGGKTSSLPSVLCCLVPEPHSFIVMKIRGGEQRRLRCVDVITRPKNS